MESKSTLLTGSQVRKDEDALGLDLGYMVQKLYLSDYPGRYRDLGFLFYPRQGRGKGASEL